MDRLRIRGLVILIAGVSVAGITIFWWYSGRPAERFRRSMIALQSGSLETVNQEVAELKKYPEYQSHVQFLEGAALLRAGQLDEAIRVFSVEPPFGEMRLATLLLTGESLYRLGRLSEAEALFRDLVAEQPQDPELHRWLATIYYDLGALAEAIEHLIVLVELKPDDYRPLWLLGHLHFDFEYYELAVARFRQALALAPPADQRIEITTKLGRALVRQRDYSEALKVLADVSLTPEILVLQAESYLAVGNRGQAEELLSQAEALDSSYLQLFVLKGRMLLEDGQAELALPLLKKAVGLDPHNYETRYQLSQALQRLGDKDAAEAELSQMKKSKELREKLTKLHFEAFSRPRDPEIRQQLAEVCTQLGKPELAEMWQQAADTYRQE